MKKIKISSLGVLGDIFETIKLEDVMINYEIHPHRRFIIELPNGKKYIMSNYDIEEYETKT